MSFAAFAASLLFVSLAGAQQDLWARAIVSYQLFGTGELNFKGLQQTYDLRYVRQVTDPFRLRLSFRGQGSDGHSQLGLTTTDTTFWQLQPSAEAWYNIEKVHANATYDLYDTRSSYNELEDKRKLQRVTGSLIWLPDDLPSLTLQGEHRQQKDELAGIDQKYDLALESLNFTRPTWMLGQTATYQSLNLNTENFTRKYLNVQGQAQYQDTLFNGRLSASAYATVGFSRIEDQARGGPASVPTQVSIPTASVSVDETPADSRDVPPIPSQALIDGDFNRSAGISLGPDGVSFQNIFFDMQRFVALDQFRIFVRDSGTNLVKIGGLVQWSVYTSDNNLDWTLVPGSITTSYVTTLAAYDVFFLQKAARYFKLVSFGTSTVETFVTEVQAYFHTAFAAGESARTDLRILTSTVQLTGHLTDWLALSYYGLMNDYHSSPGGKADYSSLDHDQLVTLEGRPSDRLDVILKYEYRHAESGTFAENLQGYWLTAQYLFSPRLNATLEASRIVDTNTFSVTTDTLRLHQYARLYNNLELSLDAGVARGNEPDLGLKTTQTFLTGYAYGQLTRDLKLTLSANLQRTNFEGPGAAALDFTRTRDQRAYAELYYRSSGKLLLSARFGYVWGTFVSARINTYRVEWYPFAGGTIGIGTIYDENIESNAMSRRFRRIQLLPHWQVNRWAMLDVNLNWLTLKSTLPGVTQESHARQFYVTLTLTL